MTPGGRRAVAALAALAAAACASMNTPPGGPDDAAAPVLESVTPDSGATNVRAPAVVFRFDEVINDRGGDAELEQLVLISPRDGAPRVRWRRDALEVRPRGGWRANTTYQVTLLPGAADLRGNRTTVTRTLVFSTGPAIATQRVVGRAWDWVGERPATSALVEATSADSTVYVAATDTAGAYRVGPLSGGVYHVRAFLDANRNRALDRGEAWDSATVEVVQEQALADLFLALRDTLPPRIASVSVEDSVRIAVEFDRSIDPADTLTFDRFVVRRADSTVVSVQTVASRRDLARAREAAVRGDSARADSARAPAGPPRPTGPARPSRPAPQTQFVLTLGERLTPGASYRVRVTRARSLGGRSGPSDRVFSVPATRAPSDTARGAPPPALRPPR